MFAQQQWNIRNTVQANVEESPQQKTARAINQVSVNITGLKSYTAYSLTITELISKSITSENFPTYLEIKVYC